MSVNAYSIVLYAIFIASAATFVALLFLEAPYGRFTRGGWGVTLSARWAWAIMEFPAALSILMMALLSSGYGPIPLIFLAVWEIHYLYRTFVYPRLLRGSGSKYMPIVLVLMAILYNVGNGYVNGYNLFVRRVYDASWLADPRFIAGMAVFACGMVMHIGSDRTLQKLRPAGTREYGVPHGGMFRFVSSPNYLGEIIQWGGFALATWSVAGLSFAVFTVANLLPRALSNHRWYQETFPDYPRERRAIIPFLL